MLHTMKSLAHTILLYIIGFAVIFSLLCVFLVPWYAVNRAAALYADGAAGFEEDYFTSMQKLMFIIAAAQLLLGGLIGFIITGMVVRPIKELVHATDALIQGTTNDLPLTERQDDLGHLAVNFGLLLREVTIDRNILETVYKNNMEKYRIAFWDDLTKTVIESHFKTLLEDEIVRCVRYSRPFSLLQLHIDKIEEIAATHPQEDINEILQRVGQLLIRMLRDVDIVGRFSDYDFICLLPETLLTGCEVVGNRIIENAETLNILSVQGHSVQISLSIGIAQFPRNGKSIDILLTEIKKATDQAIHLGGNKVIFSA